MGGGAQPRIAHGIDTDVSDSVKHYGFHAGQRRRFRRRGTFPPARRACDRPIAMACLRLFTFLPERPLRSVPRLRSRIAFLTFSCAFFPYRAMGFSVITALWKGTD